MEENEAIKNSEENNVTNEQVNKDSATDIPTTPSKKTKKPLTPKQEKVWNITKRLSKRWFIDAFTGMAQGLFCTLIAGTILGQIGTWIHGAGTDAGIAVGNFILSIANLAKILMGAGIGIGIATRLKMPALVVFSAAIAGFAGAFADKITGGTFAISILPIPAPSPGNPIGAYVVSLIAIEIGNLICGKTKVDIVLVPLAMMVVTAVSLWIAWPIIKFISLLGEGIALATDATPFVMGIVVAAVMGLILTLPTSSAAMWVAIAMPIIGPATTASLAMQNAMYLAGGAATVGCACHMVGFAVQSFRENKWGGLVAQGLGTSMLQIPNLMKHPQILIPPTIAAMISGPIATCVFKLRCGISGGGMGTSGLVGLFDTITSSQGIIDGWKIGLGIAVCMFIIPVAVCLFVSEFMRKKGWIKLGDMTIPQ